MTDTIADKLNDLLRDLRECEKVATEIADEHYAKDAFSSDVNRIAFARFRTMERIQMQLTAIREQVEILAE